MCKEDVLKLARRHRIPVVPVELPGGSAELAGYVRVIDLGLSMSGEVAPLRRLMEISEVTSHVVALMRMQSAKESLARVVGASGETVGIVTADRLRERLFRGGHQA